MKYGVYTIRTIPDPAMIIPSRSKLDIVYMFIKTWNDSPSPVSMRMGKLTIVACVWRCNGNIVSGIGDFSKNNTFNNENTSKSPCLGD